MKPDWFKLAEVGGYPVRKISGYLKRIGSGFFRPLIYLFRGGWALYGQCARFYVAVGGLV